MKQLEYSLDHRRNQTLTEVLNCKTTIHAYHLRKTLYEQAISGGNGEHLRLIPWVGDSFLRQTLDTLLDSFKYLCQLNVRTDFEGGRHLMSHMLKISKTCADTQSAFAYFNTKASVMEEFSMERSGLVLGSDSNHLAMEEGDLHGDSGIPSSDAEVEILQGDSASCCVLTQGSNTYPAKCKLGKVSNMSRIKSGQDSFAAGVDRPYRTSTPVTSMNSDADDTLRLELYLSDTSLEDKHLLGDTNSNDSTNPILVVNRSYRTSTPIVDVNPDESTLHGELDISDVFVKSEQISGDLDFSYSHLGDDNALGHDSAPVVHGSDNSVDPEAATIPWSDHSHDTSDDYHSRVFLIRREEELRLLIAAHDSLHSDTDPVNE